MKKSLYRRNQFEDVLDHKIREALGETPEQKPEKKKPTHHESKLQRGCVKWFRLQYPNHTKLLFAIPNGGFRSGHEASIMHGEGVTPGVADLMLAIPRHGHHGLFIEMKYGKNDLSQHQQEFKRAVQSQNYKFVVCWDIDQFVAEVNRYLTRF